MGSHTGVPPALAAQPRDRRRGFPVPYAQHRQSTDVEGEVDADFAVLDPTRMLEVARRWVETKPEEFVMYLTRSFSYELRTASGGGLAGVFVPAAPHHLRRFSWGPDGVLTELPEEGGDV